MKRATGQRPKLHMKALGFGGRRIMMDREQLADINRSAREMAQSAEWGDSDRAGDPQLARAWERLGDAADCLVAILERETHYRNDVPNVDGLVAMYRKAALMRED